MCFVCVRIFVTNTSKCIQCVNYIPKQRGNCEQIEMPSIGVNLRVTGHCSQGGRKYMEDFFSVAYQQGLTDQRDFEYAFIGIYDGLYTKSHYTCYISKIGQPHSQPKWLRLSSS